MLNTHLWPKPATRRWLTSRDWRWREHVHLPDLFEELAKIVANASYSPPTATLHTASSFNLITHKHSNSVGPDSAVEPTHPLLCEDNLVKAATSFPFLEVRRSAEYF